MPYAIWLLTLLAWVEIARGSWTPDYFSPPIRSGFSLGHTGPESRSRSSSVGFLWGRLAISTLLAVLSTCAFGRSRCARRDVGAEFPAASRLGS